MNRLRKNTNNQLLLSIPAYSVRLCVVMLLLALSHSSYAQVSRYIQKGNSLYGQKKYKEAAADYAKALEKNPTYSGMFNLGNSLYQQKKYDSSRKVMQATAKLSTDKSGKAATDYNIGNSYMSEQKWEEAANAYKDALRKNPQDADAKYNLSYANQMLKKQEQEQKDKKDDKKDDKKKDDKDKKDDKKDKKDENKDKDKDKEDKNDKDQDKKDKDGKDKPEPQNQPGKISKEKADQILNALQNAEKKLQDKMKKEKGVPVKLDKDW